MKYLKLLGIIWENIPERFDVILHIFCSNRSLELAKLAELFLVNKLDKGVWHVNVLYIYKYIWPNVSHFA